MSGRLIGAFALIAALAPAAASAQEAAPASETSVFVFNTLLFLSGGMMAMSAAAGFALRAAGLVRAKNAASVCLLIIAAYAAATLAFWLIGYNLLNGVEAGGFLGVFALWAPSDIDPVGAGRASAAAWLFQAGCAAVPAAIVAGALAERLKVWPFLIFAAALSGLIYPIIASWDWGKGYLDAAWKFVDVAGATIVHATGGWAALAGALIIGPRRGRYGAKGVQPMPGSNLPIAALGTFLLWFGWFGFSSASELALGSISSAVSIARMIVNTNMAAAGGIVAAIVLASIVYKKIDLATALNAAIGGLVSISADPLSPQIWQAALIGAFAGVIVTVAATGLDRLRIDDTVGAIPAHLLCGLWGALVVPWSNPDASILGQLVGISMIAVFAFGMSALIWTTLKYSIGVRPGPEQEAIGIDRTSLGVDAYRDFDNG
jgi:Amt family ammonium transporter